MEGNKSYRQLKAARIENHRRRKTRRRIIVVLSIAAVAVTAIIIVLGNSGPRRTGDVTLRIEPGASTAEIAAMLKNEDVIESEKDFLRQAEEAGTAGELEAGTYRFTRGQSVESILQMLEQGQRAPEGVLAVPEGFTVREIADEVAAKTDISKDGYLSAATPTGRRLPLAGTTAITSLEGFLFPSTYDLEPGIEARELVELQLKSFETQTSSLPWEKAGALGLTEYEVLTIASMVEREARAPEERPLVAAVIYNRLDAGMKLEVDATVQYALGFWKTELTQQDLETDSPYNTRLYQGLPPGPICNPGADSIQAALEPADVDYIFYIAEGDAEGHHFFTASYEEFLRVKEGR